MSRQMVYGDRAMVAKIFLKKGAVVPPHKHENEQLSWVVDGVLEFTVAGEKLIVHSDEILTIPSMAEHSVVALEDTYDVDVFSPIRQDWIRGEDSYLRI